MLGIQFATAADGVAYPLRRVHKAHKPRRTERLQTLVQPALCAHRSRDLPNGLAPLLALTTKLALLALHLFHETAE